MTKLLHIIASPRAKSSQSNAVADAYVAARKAINPNLEVEVIDLWNEELPEFDGDKVAAKMTFFGVGEMDEPRQSAWDKIVAVTQNFMAADEYVFAVPMWNGGIPYKLKQYIDVITQPGMLFGFSPEDGYSGLLENKKATLVYTAGVFAPDVDPKYGIDYQSTYLDWWLNVIGINDINTLRFQPSLLTADPQGEQAQAIERAKALASA